ncbi:MAG: diguanylate cyclase [Peptostreptococcaceae bacterium]|jgi:diguanylate cyclase (GGDEF)-like protein|nr:diguanylate cyclase [Peptostreptococcaceae bacterium]
MDKYFWNREYTIWMVLSAIIIVIWGFITMTIFTSHNNKEESFLDSELRSFEGEVHSTLKTYEEFSNFLYQEINGSKEISEIMYKANFASKEKKNELRMSLYDLLESSYLNMQNYYFRQLHFHLPNTESFLRMHRPSKYGDILSSVRESVRIANKNEVYTTGFEEGRIYNGFRFVYPLNYKNTHTGSVEVSISSASIVEVLSKLYPKKDFIFVMDKKVVKEKVFDDQLSNYLESNVSSKFLVDKEVEEISLGYKNTIPKNDKDFFSKVVKNHESDIENWNDFAIPIDYDGQNFMVKFLKIENIKKIPVAYLISVSENNEYPKIYKDLYQQIFLVTILAFFIIIFGLILASYQYKLKMASQYDHLTKIYNRHKFLEIVERELKKLKRYKHSCAVILMDIDFFKNINDTYGHEWGDQVLRELATSIEKNIRQTDVFARWGGEEFIIFLSHTNESNAFNVADKLRKIIEEETTEKLKEITLSLGVSLVLEDDSSINDSIDRADEAMYNAKRTGRNKVCCYSNLNK